MEEFKIPELGENIEEAVVIKVLVKQGDQVSKDQALVELETDKAAVEVPSSVDGTIKEVRIKEGDKARVGDVIFVIDRGGAETAVTEEKVSAGERKEAEAVEDAVEEARDEPKEEPVAAKETPVEKAPVAEERYRPGEKVAPAAPSVRRFAREIGIDVNTIPGSGPRGRISSEWRRLREFPSAAADATAVYLARLFAIELLMPQFCAPGVLEHAAEEAGIDPAVLSRVRDDATIRQLVASLQ